MVRSADPLDITIAVDCDIKNQTNQIRKVGKSLAYVDKFR